MYWHYRGLRISDVTTGYMGMKLSCHEWPFFSALPVSESHCVIRENIRRLRSTQCNTLVAHAPDSDDQFRMLDILLQFLTEVSNMNIHSPTECSTVITPDWAQEFVTRDRASGPYQWDDEEAETPAAWDKPVCRFSSPGVARYRHGAGQICEHPYAGSGPVLRRWPFSVLGSVHSRLRGRVLANRVSAPLTWLFS